MKIEPITAEMAEKYREQIAQLYYENVRSNAFHSHYTYDEAYEKIGSLIDHLRDDTAIVYCAFEYEELIAFIWAYVHQFREENRMYVSEIRVKEEYQKRGIGSSIGMCFGTVVAVLIIQRADQRSVCGDGPRLLRGAAVAD